MSIETFDDLLRMTQQQAQPQRLLLVFANAELPDDASPDQRRAFERGEGGALVPHMCVDKLPAEIEGFNQLLQESADHSAYWMVLFVAAMSGVQGVAPTSQAADPHLQGMVEMIRLGRLEGLVPFDRRGHTMQLA